MHDRRRFKRLPMRGFLECRVGFTLGDDSRSYAVLSLSAGGMYIAVDADTDAGLDRGVTLTEIRFDLDGLRTVALTGHVAHRMSLGEIGGCGIEFDDCSDADRTLLEQFVEEKLADFGLAFF